MTRTQDIRNIALIAHVDHGKTTLVDQLLVQSGSLQQRAETPNRVMDSNDLERERGITILAKNTAITWKGAHINVVDTPGHADFGGEVERILSMVDSVLLIVDAVEGTMPQTRFVTQKAFQQGLKPIVVINKIDRPGSRPDVVIEQVFDLFDALGATDEQLDFSVVYASALQGFATCDMDERSDNMSPLLDIIVNEIPAPIYQDGPFQMQISALDYSDYLGVIGIGRVHRGRIGVNSAVTIIDKQGNLRSGKLNQIFGYIGLERESIEAAVCGDIVAVTGIEDLTISETICDKEHPDALPVMQVDEPTISMTFRGNDSPFCGQDGKYLTSRHVRDRLNREAIHNVALGVKETESPDQILVAGRGTLHLGILCETMRREQYEFSVSQPQVIVRETPSGREEPYEMLVMDVETSVQGAIMQYVGERCGKMQDMQPCGKERVRLEYLIPSRSLIGFHSVFQTMTSGSGVLSHVFHHYGPHQSDLVMGRQQGVMISNASGVASGYALFNLQARGRLFIGPQTPVYEGMIVGIHARENDLVVNVTKEKKLTNVRASGTDEAIILTPPIQLSLEYALDFINDDELVEITPNNLRLRKKWLSENLRKRQKGNKD